MGPPSQRERGARRAARQVARCLPRSVVAVPDHDRRGSDNPWPSRIRGAVLTHARSPGLTWNQRRRQPRLVLHLPTRAAQAGSARHHQFPAARRRDRDALGLAAARQYGWPTAGPEAWLAVVADPSPQPDQRSALGGRIRRAGRADALGLGRPRALPALGLPRARLW